MADVEKLPDGNYFRPVLERARAICPARTSAIRPNSNRPNSNRPISSDWMFHCGMKKIVGGETITATAEVDAARDPPMPWRGADGAATHIEPGCRFWRFELIPTARTYGRETEKKPQES